MNLKKYFLLILALLYSTSIIAAGDSLEIFSPKYFNEQKKELDDIHYLPEEYLSFKFCTDIKAKNITAKLKCDTNLTQDLEIELFEKNSNEICYISNFELENLECSDFSLNIDYNKEGILKTQKRTFTQSKQSRLINQLLGKDPKLLDPIDISSVLIVQTDISGKNNKESEELYDALKNKRNNQNKCWPANACSLLETSQILRNLKLIEYDDESRLISDGQTYLEKYIQNIEANDYEFEITLSDTWEEKDEDGDIDEVDADCDITIDGDVNTENFDDNDYFFDDDFNNEIIMKCNRNIDKITLNIYHDDYNYQNTKVYENTDGFTHEQENFKCIGQNEICNYEATLNAIFTYGSSFEDYAKLKQYIDARKITSNSQTYLYSPTSYSHMGIYLLENSDKEITQYLKYKQNNDGSWGTKNSKYDKILDTSWAIQGLEELNSDSENLEDGKKWIYYNEPSFGWGSTEKNALAYLAIKENLNPYLQISTPNKIVDTTSFKIKNPTIYNIKNLRVEFDEELNKHLSYDQYLDNIVGEDEVNLEVNVNEDFFGRKAGFMYLKGYDEKNKELELVKMPVIISSKQPFEINFDKNYSISEDFGNLDIPIWNTSSSEFNFECEYVNPFTKEKEKTNITHTTQKITINNPESASGSQNINFVCGAEENSFEIEGILNIEKIEPTFESESEKLEIIDTNDFYVTITNIGEEKQIITIELQGELSNFLQPVENQKIIAKGDTREIYFRITSPEAIEMMTNKTAYAILKSDSGYSKKIEITNSIMPMSAGDRTNGFWMWFGIGIFTLFAILFIIRRYRHIQLEKEYEREHSLNQNEEEIVLDENFNME